MGAITTTQTWADTDTVTSTKLTNIADGSSMTTDAITGTTLAIDAGKLKVNVIGTAQIGTDAVTTPKIAAGAVTGNEIASGSVAYTHLASSDLATQADMEAETGSHIAPVDLLKHHPGIPKAYGMITYDLSAPTVASGAYNVSSVSEVSGSDRQVTLSVTMADTNYIVVCEGVNFASSFDISTKTTTTFVIDPSNVESSGQLISFVVYGKLA